MSENSSELALLGWLSLKMVARVLPQRAPEGPQREYAHSDIGNEETSAIGMPRQRFPMSL